MRQTSVGTLLFLAVEVLDFAGRYKVFTTTIEGLGDRLGSLKLSTA